MTKNKRPIRARLFYKSTCPPCKWMSKLATILSLGTIKRISIYGEEAETLYQQYPDHRGQLVLKVGKKVTFGRSVFAEVPRCIVMAWFNLIRSIA
ncbi:hypothetical protein [Kordia sp.]|uniref:hypothetical protein n=1 Tax=Kordia sp. TaxID=1965332 RepID=UPI003D6A6391